MINSNNIGLIGISQGSWVSTLAANMSDSVMFIVAVSGPGTDSVTQNIYSKLENVR